MAKKTPTKASFKESLEELERITQEIESNPLELEELVGRYEEGMRLLSHCKKILDHTQHKLIQLNTEDLASPSSPDTPSEDNDILFKLQ